ncbi:hypothetical protein GCM10027269_54040 [Kribbella endophytica]
MEREPDLGVQVLQAFEFGAGCVEPDFRDAAIAEAEDGALHADREELGVLVAEGADMLGDDVVGVLHAPSLGGCPVDAEWISGDGGSAGLR